jgi:hypothetical protein
MEYLTQFFWEVGSFQGFVNIFLGTQVNIKVGQAKYPLLGIKPDLL